MNELSRTAASPMRTGASFLCLAAGTVLATGLIAAASPLDPFIVLSASNAGGSGSITVPLAATTLLPNGTRTYNQVGSIAIMDGANLIATVNGLISIVRPLQSPALGHGINLTFDLVGGPSLTTVTIDSALFDIPSNPLAAARLSANVSVTDNNSNGVFLTGLNAGGLAYRAATNGAAPGGTQFGALFSSVNDPLPGGSNNASGALPGGGLYTAIAPATDMSSRWSFTISGGDQAAGGSIYEIIPGPGAMGLFGLAGLGLLRRTRR